VLKGKNILVLQAPVEGTGWALSCLLARLVITAAASPARVLAHDADVLVPGACSRLARWRGLSQPSVLPVLGRA